MRDHEAIINKIFKLLCGFKPQPEALREHLRGVLTGKFYPHRKVLFKSGTVVKDLLFVSDGFVVCYGFNDLGDGQVVGIAARNSIVFGRSFTTQSPSIFEWVCLPGTYLLSMDSETLLDTYARFPGTEELARIVLADAVEKELLTRISLNRDAELVVESFYHRFREFKFSGRMLVDADIASYLMIAESTLRNVRAKLSREGRF